MIVICEECGKKYRIDPEKIKGRQAKFKCTSCGHVVTVSKTGGSSGAAGEAAKAPEAETAPREETPRRGPSPEPEEEKAPPKTEEPEKEAPRVAVPKGARFGIRSKMMLLFFLIPILIMVGASLLYLRQMERLGSLTLGESSELVRRLSEKAIAEKARSVAMQVKLYLEGHPGLEKEEFQDNLDFKRIAVQKVGQTGYTAVYELPDENGVWRTWAHANPKIVGIDMRKLKKPMGKSFPGFWKVFSGVKGGVESEGYYTWQDADGAFRDKYMVCTPVEGTPFIVAATTYLYEFTLPMRKLENRVQELRTNTMNVSIGLLVATLIIVGLIVSTYAQLLTRKIRQLTQVAERISVGDLEAEITVKGRDEIGELRDAISRMQDSVRLSIERLRRRR